MNVRWLLIAGLVAGLGCGDGGANDGTAGSAGNPGSRGDTDCVWTADNANMCKVCAADATCDAPSYTHNGDGTVTSSCCGLVWQQVPGMWDFDDEERFTWDEAKTYCAGLVLAGGGWRLATSAELTSLVVLGQTPEEPTIDRTAFPETVAEYFWSSSPAVGLSGYGWYVYFGNGSSSYYDPSNTGRVRCVR